MANDQDKSQEPGSVDHQESGDFEDPNPSPIVITAGGGAFARVPIPAQVVDRLGGSSRLLARLHPILEAEALGSSSISPGAAVKLTAQYDELFDHLETITADLSPIHIDKRGGSSITVPIPREVVDRLGGSSRLLARLHPILDAEALGSSSITPDAAVKLTTQYEELFDQLGAIIA
jgi:hypothetical protein